MNDQESHDCKKAVELIDYALGVLTVTPTPSESDLRGVKYMLRDASARLSRDSSGFIGCTPKVSEVLNLYAGKDIPVTISAPAAAVRPLKPELPDEIQCPSCGKVHFAGSEYADNLKRSIPRRAKLEAVAVAATFFLVECRMCHGRGVMTFGDGSESVCTKCQPVRDALAALINHQK